MKESDPPRPIVIIGSGIAGALTAERLAASGLPVLIIEAGAPVDRARAVDRFLMSPIKTPECAYESSPFADFPRTESPDQWYQQQGPVPFKSTYLRVVGGTSWHWLGTCLRFLPADFRLRGHYGRGLDWPIDYAQLETWYERAERALGVSGDHRTDPWLKGRSEFPQPAIPQTYLDRLFHRALQHSPYEVTPTPQARNSGPYEGRPACCGSASCIPICPVQAKYDATIPLQQALAQGAQLWSQTVVSRLIAGPNGVIRALEYRRWDGSSGFLEARRFILACNGIETPRLLLASADERYPKGLANRSDQVGRNLMDHPVQLSWAQSSDPVYPYRGPISTSGIENLRDGAFRRERAAFRIQISNDGWSWPTGGLPAAVDQLMSQGLQGRALDQAIRHSASRHLQLAALMEELPDPFNRVTLDPKHRDGLGLAKPALRYRHGAYVLDGLKASRRAHEAIFQRMGATEIHHATEPQGAGHILGTTRMGDSPETSVVDANLRCHDHPNLYLVGGSVFPTGGTANPTLTIAALALRLAETLKNQPDA